MAGAASSAGSPRRRDAAATRGAILDAAKAQFGRLGYDRSTLRHIAGDAGVDVALIKRYFGGKETLFVEALKASFHTDFRSQWDRRTFAEDFATSVAGGPHEDEARTHRFQFLLRAATSPTTAPLLNEAIRERFLSPIQEWLGDAAGDPARARVLAAAIIGFLVERLVRGEPLTGAERDAFIERAAGVFRQIVSDPSG